jgi:ATPase subunit of ABC transporter with duplicated ATPase domains
VVFGEIGQARSLFAPNEPLIGSFCAESLPGERTRAELALQAARGAGCLVLDEPTNHLVEELERALSVFDGTLILVTHDRRFLERVGVKRVFDLSREAPDPDRSTAPRRPRARR